MAGQKLSIKENRDLILQKLDRAEFLAHTQDSNVHTTQEEKTQLTTHISDAKVHITTTERAMLTSITESLGKKANNADLVNHSDNKILHVTKEDHDEISKIPSMQSNLVGLSSQIESLRTYVMNAVGNSNSDNVTIIGSGVGTFSALSGTIIPHAIGNTNYVVTVTPKGLPEGTIGEISVAVGTDSIIVYNTGTGKGEFFYLLTKLI